MLLLEYSKWENFHKVIKDAMISCNASNYSILDDFPEVRKNVKAGATSKKVKDYKLSRYACYLKEKVLDIEKIFLIIWEVQNLLLIYLE